MFDRLGIGVEDLAWIHRDQFVHYVELAHALGDPGDWSRFRHDLLRALTAAFGLDAGKGVGLPPSQRRALRVLDEVRRRYDPATNWATFFEALWSRRHAIRADLPGPDQEADLPQEPRGPVTIRSPNGQLPPEARTNMRGLR